MRDERERPGEHGRRRLEPWPLGLAALLLSMISASLTFLGVATRHPDPLVVEDAYGAGLRYSERLRAERRAENLGWQIALEATPQGDGARVRVRARDAEGRPLAGARVSLRRERPAEGGLDAEAALRPDGEGFAGVIALPRPGRWHLIARVDRDGERAERRFELERPR